VGNEASVLVAISCSAGFRMMVEVGSLRGSTFSSAAATIAEGEVMQLARRKHRHHEDEYLP